MSLNENIAYLSDAFLIIIFKTNNKDNNDNGSKYNSLSWNMGFDN